MFSFVLLGAGCALLLRSSKQYTADGTGEKKLNANDEEEEDEEDSAGEGAKGKGKQFMFSMRNIDAEVMESEESLFLPNCLGVVTLTELQVYKDVVMPRQEVLFYSSFQ